MKKIILILMVLILWGCTAKEKENRMEVRDDVPVKLEYSRLWGYSAYGESEDQELIGNVVEALKALSIGEKSDIAVEDYGDIITLIYADGSRETYSFEAEYIVLDDGKRAVVNGDLDRVRSLLNVLVEEE